jgi:hypothetical protein
MIVQELFNSQVCTVNATTSLIAAGNSGSFGGFLCTTAGNFTLTDASGTVIIPQMAVTSTYFVPGGILSNNGLKVVSSGGCVGTVYYGPNA